MDKPGITNDFITIKLDKGWGNSPLTFTMVKQLEKITLITWCTRFTDKVEKRKCNYYPDIGWAFSLDENNKELDGGFAVYHDCCHFEDLEGNIVDLSESKPKIIL